MRILKCRVCGHGEAVSLGQMPDCGEFAGQPVTPPIKGGELWKCRDCGSMFRHPTLSSDDYISLYEKAPGTVWVEDEVERNDIVTIYACLKDHTVGSILDVGCYSGNFLAGLPGKFVKYGVEPSASASRHAASRDISILGCTLAELKENRVFDVVVSIDVIEHVLDVEDFLDLALARVKENGLLIISTGNPDCFSWRRVFKSSFWYCYFPEHLTFPSFKYFKEFAERNGLPPPRQVRFGYKKFKLKERLSKLFHFILYSFSPALYQTLSTIHAKITGGTVTKYSGPPVSPIGLFIDHHAIIIKKVKMERHRGE